jgi:hypothetical protein
MHHLWVLRNNIYCRRNLIHLVDWCVELSQALKPKTERERDLLHYIRLYTRPKQQQASNKNWSQQVICINIGWSWCAGRSVLHWKSTVRQHPVPPMLNMPHYKIAHFLSPALRSGFGGLQRKESYFVTELSTFANVTGESCESSLCVCALPQPSEHQPPNCPRTAGRRQ